MAIREANLQKTSLSAFSSGIAGVPTINSFPRQGVEGAARGWGAGNCISTNGQSAKESMSIIQNWRSGVLKCWIQTVQPVQSNIYKISSVLTIGTTRRRFVIGLITRDDINSAEWHGWGIVSSKRLPTTHHVVFAPPAWVVFSRLHRYSTSLEFNMLLLAEKEREQKNRLFKAHEQWARGVAIKCELLKARKTRDMHTKLQKELQTNLSDTVISARASWTILSILHYQLVSGWIF